LMCTQSANVTSMCGAQVVTKYRAWIDEVRRAQVDGVRRARGDEGRKTLRNTFPTNGFPLASCRWNTIFAASSLGVRVSPLATSAPANALCAERAGPRLPARRARRRENMHGGTTAGRALCSYPGGHRRRQGLAGVGRWLGREERVLRRVDQWAYRGGDRFHLVSRAIRRPKDAASATVASHAAVRYGPSMAAPLSI
jgi:hypothetical protein